MSDDHTDYDVLYVDGTSSMRPSVLAAERWLAERAGCPRDELRLTDRSSSLGSVEEYEVTRTNAAGEEVHVGTISREWR